jgi:tetrapyrrole methylase family protein/MazG family protein
MNLRNDINIYLLGSGVYSFFDLTVYTQYLLQECKSVYYLHDLPSLERHLEALTPNPVNLMPLYYIDGRDRHDIYHDITQHIIRSAGENPPVAFLMHGHPLVFSSISQMILKEGDRRGLGIEVVPAVSSLDRMFVDLKLDIADQGIQIFHTSMAMANGLVLNPKVGALFLQIGAIHDNRAKRHETVLPANVLPFKQYLLGFYPESHCIRLIECSVELGFESRLTETPIARLEEMAPFFNYNTSAYVPGMA